MYLLIRDSVISDCIEDEVHIIVRLYTKVRNELFTQATYFNNDFMQMTDIEIFLIFI